MKPTCIIVDIDGTLADIGHRLHFIRDGKKDWDGFFAAAPGDSPIPDVIAIVKAIVVANIIQSVILVSGRPERTRSDTLAWLRRFKIPMNGLYMRIEGDYREDHIIKEEILDRWILPGLDVLCAIDDRNQVVEMWRRRGITCLQVRDGNY